MNLSDELHKKYTQGEEWPRNECLANARGVIMLDKKLKQHERANQQMAKIFTVIVQELGFDKVKQVRESSERLTLALQEYVDSNSESFTAVKEGPWLAD